MSRTRTHIKRFTGSRGAKALRRAERSRDPSPSAGRSWTSGTGAAPPASPAPAPHPPGADETSFETERIAELGAEVASYESQRAAEPGAEVASFESQRAAEPAPTATVPPDAEAEDEPIVSDDVQEAFDEATELGMGAGDPGGRFTGEALEESFRTVDPAAHSSMDDEAGEGPLPGGNPFDPGSNVVEELGGEIGVEFQPDEPLGLTGKMEGRDRRRWEMNPASSEDYESRTTEEHEDPE